MSLLVDIEKQMGDFHLDVSFDTGDGFHGLLGPSGCGKSMTLRCIAGVARPDRGHIEVNGVTLFDSEHGIDLPPQQRNVGLLFQNYALFPNMTVEQNLRTVTRGMERREADRRIDSILHRFHLENRRGHLPRQLSGGEQQRTALARILLTDPRILLLDEPLSALDSYLRWQTELELMETLEDFAGTVVLVTHNRKEVYRMCRTVSVLDHGRAKGAHGTEKLFRHPRTLQECLLSGCKNYSRAELLPDGRLYAADCRLGRHPDGGGPAGRTGVLRGHPVPRHPPRGRRGGERGVLSYTETHPRREFRHRDDGHAGRDRGQQPLSCGTVR